MRLSPPQQEPQHNGKKGKTCNTTNDTSYNGASIFERLSVNPPHRLKKNLRFEEPEDEDPEEPPVMVAVGDTVTTPSGLVTVT